MVESNELIKKDFNVDRDCIPLEEQTKIFNELVDERSPKFWNLQKRINSDNLIYKYKTEGISPKDFSNYPNLIDLFKNLRDGNINSKKLLKNQVNFKYLKKKIRFRWNRKRKFKFKIKRSNKCYTKCWKSFWFKKKNHFFRYYSFLLSEAKYKEKYAEGLKILTSKQMLQRLPVVLVQVKAGNISENWQNEIRQIIHFLYRTKEIAKKAYNSITN